MTAETETALTVIEEPRVVRLGDTKPLSTIALATEMANALTDIVEKKRLFAVISGKKFPTVEAWMTIARMDNVVAREAEPPVRHEDGSYEAFVELVRLSDGLVVGRGSALCGTDGDNPWTKRADPQKRSMAVTRATSRAFRQQYSWIMALAGYEATPAEEMPQDAPRNVSPDPYGSDDGAGAAETRTTHRDGLIGKAITQGTQDFELRQHPDKGFTLPFRIKEGRLNQIVLAQGELALQLADAREQVVDNRITVWGRYEPQSFPDRKRPGEDVTYNVLFAERVRLPDGTDLPKAIPVSPLRDPEDEAMAAVPVAEGQQEAFTESEEAAIDAAMEKAASA